MNIPLIRIYELADLLEKNGQIRITPKNDKLGIEIYEDPNAEGITKILIPGVIQRPSIGIISPDGFFKELQNEIESHLPKIKKLVFQDGGTIPIPDWFRDWCKDSGINIKWVNNELIKLEITPEAREIFSDLIDEL
jgi:protein involved in polysaccharide export with SLBB domain